MGPYLVTPPPLYQTLIVLGRKRLYNLHTSNFLYEGCCIFWFGEGRFSVEYCCSPVVGVATSNSEQSNRQPCVLLYSTCCSDHQQPCSKPEESTCTARHRDARLQSIACSKIMQRQQEDTHLFLSQGVDGPSMSSVLASTRNEVIDRFRGSNKGNVFVSKCGGLLRAGEFVLYGANQWMKSHRFDDKLVVGQIIAIADLRDIPEDEMGSRFWRGNRKTHGRERFVLLRSMPFLDYDDFDMDKPDAETYPFLPASLREVEMSCELQWIDGKHIKSIAFVINVSFLEGIGFRFWGDSMGIPAVSFALTVSQMITVNENDPILQKKNAHAIPIQSLHSWYNLLERQQCFCWRN
jgi:hypothetical protein